MQRILGEEAVLAGSVTRETVFHPTASFRFRIRAAPGAHAVTAFLLTELATSATAVVAPKDATEDNNATAAVTTTIAPNAWNVIKRNAIPNTATNACGVQMYQLKGKFFLQLWCYNAKTGRIAAQVQPLDKDPAAETHRFELRVTPLVEGMWTLSLRMNEEDLLVISDGKLLFLKKFSAELLKNHF